MAVDNSSGGSDSESGENSNRKSHAQLKLIEYDKTELRISEQHINDSKDPKDRRLYLIKRMLNKKLEPEDNRVDAGIQTYGRAEFAVEDALPSPDGSLEKANDDPEGPAKMRPHDAREIELVSMQARDLSTRRNRV